MKDEEAALILKKLLERPDLKEEEKEAILKAIGLFSWTKYAENRIENAGEKKRKKNLL